MTKEVVDTVADAIVNNEVHMERLLKEEVALVINLLHVIDGAAVHDVKTTCNMTLS